MFQINILCFRYMYYVLDICIVFCTYGPPDTGPVNNNFPLKMKYENKPNPEHGIKGTRQKVIVTHNPSEIDQNQLLLVRFPNLGSDDVIVPGTANLSFHIELSFSE